ncbi:hypothetical protein ACIRL0_11900 [Streptomyces sp. NPDC102365]|uniref:hypothetical protein n=1 Tax=Streptomyces sp. NPDC102365 TaxID=3366162 RepID=UPI0037FAA020
MRLSSGADAAAQTAKSAETARLAADLRRSGVRVVVDDASQKSAIFYKNQRHPAGESGRWGAARIFAEYRGIVRRASP